MAEKKTTAKKTPAKKAAPAPVKEKKPEVKTRSLKEMFWERARQKDA